MNRPIILILLIGIILRVSVFIASPPNNSYDDHLEVVVKTIVELQIPSRVDPWECWECYQPPLYYWVASGVVLLSSTVVDDVGAWKAVQSLSLVASCFTLFLTAIALLLVLPRLETRPALYACLAVFAALPRAIYSSAMTTNDAFLEAAVVMGLVGFLFLFKRENHINLGVAMIAVGTLAACWIKQSGLILIVPVVGLLFATLTDRWNPPGVIRKEIIIFGLVLLLFLAGLDEVWRYARSGIFLVSNQQYYDYASSQPPGFLSDISFFSIKGGALLESVFMEKETLGSYWTEILARFWFDYERRFFPINSIAIMVGQVAYIVGAVITILFAIASGNYVFRKPYDMQKALLLFFAISFLAVPILQTLRFPYYSSMKAVFVLPGVPAMLCLAGLGVAAWLPFRPVRLFLKIVVSVSLLFGFLHVAFLTALSSEAWRHGLSGPLWPLPALP